MYALVISAFCAVVSTIPIFTCNTAVISAGWNEAVTPAVLLRLVRLCPEVNGLNLSYCHKLHAENLHTYLSLCHRLQRLDLTNIMAVSILLY